MPISCVEAPQSIIQTVSGHGLDTSVSSKQTVQINPVYPPTTVVLSPLLITLAMDLLHTDSLHYGLEENLDEEYVEEYQHV